MENKRILALRESIRRHGLDGMLIAESTSLLYLADIADRAWLYRPSYDVELPYFDAPRGYPKKAPDAVLYVPADGESVLLYAPPREAEFACCGLNAQPYYIASCQLALEKHISGKRIGVGEWCADFLREALHSLNGNIEVVPAEQLVRELRCIKDEHEIELLRQVARFTDDAMAHVVATLREGITPLDIQRSLVEHSLAAGLPDEPFPATAMIYKRDQGYIPLNAPLERESTVSFDFGYVMKGYCSEFGRSFYIGDNPEPLQRHYHALNYALTSVVADIRPGETNIRDIGLMIWDRMNERGCARHLRNLFNFNMTGHQIGLEVHEYPCLFDNADFIARPGMVMCIEPKVSIRGIGYLRMEDMVLITETGAELLTNFDRELFLLK